MVSFINDGSLHPQQQQQGFFNQGNQQHPYYPNGMNAAGRQYHAEMQRQMHQYNPQMRQQMQQPNQQGNGFGFPPNPHPDTFGPQYTNPQQQQPGLFRNNLFMQTHNASVDIVDGEQVLFVKNYQQLDKLSEDKELNALYFSNPDYLWELFYKQLSECGRWMNEAYAVFNSASALVITTPLVTMRVDKDSLKFYYSEHLVRAMDDEQVTKGLIPILKIIDCAYIKDEEIKRQAEVDRLKQREAKEKSTSEEVTPKPDQKKYIPLNSRKIKNTKANYRAFIKAIDEGGSNLSRFLHVSSAAINYMLECASSLVDGLAGIYTIDGVTINSDERDYSIIIAGDLKISLNVLNNSPMLQIFEFTDLRNEKVIESAITLCKQLDLLDTTI